MAITYTICDAGRDVLINGQQQGWGPAVLVEMAIGSGQWSPDHTATSLQSEIKRLPIEGGADLGDGRLHAFARDDSADTWDAYEIGLYVEDDQNNKALLAIVSDTNPYVSKTNTSVAFVSTDIKLTGVINPAQVTFGNTDYTWASASEAMEGLVALASESEALAGTDNTKAMTPLRVEQVVPDRSTPTEAENGANNNTYMNPARVKYAVGVHGVKNADNPNSGSAGTFDIEGLPIGSGWPIKITLSRPGEADESFTLGVHLGEAKKGESRVYAMTPESTYGAVKNWTKVHEATQQEADAAGVSLLSWRVIGDCLEVWGMFNFAGMFKTVNLYNVNPNLQFHSSIRNAVSISVTPEGPDALGLGDMGAWLLSSREIEFYSEKSIQLVEPVSFHAIGRASQATIDAYGIDN